MRVRRLERGVPEVLLRYTACWDMGQCILHMTSVVVCQFRDQDRRILRLGYVESTRECEGSR